MIPDKPNARVPFRYSLCVSGAAGGETMRKSAGLAEAMGVAIAKRGHILTTGATVGLPYFAARGAKSVGGMSIGFSPAESLREHLLKYRLPQDCYDFINFTGLHYVGRDLYLVQSSDAVITVGGRFGSLHEFTSALEARKPCGVLLGSGGTADVVPELVKALREPELSDLIIYDEDPVRLVDKIIVVLDEKYADLREHLAKHDHTWFLKHKKFPPHTG